MPEKVDTRYFTRLQRISNVTHTSQGLLADLDDELLRVDVLRDDVMRVKISRGRVFDETPTFAVQADLPSLQSTFTIGEQPDSVSVSTSAMTLVINLAPFHLSAHRADGSTIFETAKDADGNYWAYATLNDAFVVKRPCLPDDAFFGLGEKSGAFNRKGRDFTLWNNDVLDPNSAGVFTAGLDKSNPRSDRTSIEYDPYYVSIPFFYHMAHKGNQAAGFFIDNGYRAHVDFSQDTSYSFRFEGGQYTEYIFAGPFMREILSSYTWLTGRMLPPPLWSLGYHQCRWFPYTQDAVERIAAEHRERGIPCDVLWLDIEYMDGYRVFTWNTEAFPDVPGMLGRLAEQGLRVITIIDPGVKYEQGYSVFDQAVERDTLCKTEGGDIYIGQVWPGKTAFPDFVRQEARDWWGELNAAHVRSGLAGIWNDMNEPATGDIPTDAMRFGNGEYSHARYHNQYALLMAMGTTDGLLQAMPDKRTFVLSRAGFSGIQRYAANWMGDNMSRWDHLWLSVPMALGFGISGQPFVGADIGGFAGHSNAELFVRWMQCGVLTPFCRNHSAIGNIDQYAWSFGEVVEGICRTAIRMRYRLMPYLYAAFMHSAETGEPVQKPLVFEYQHDRTLRDLNDQYLLGANLLVAPIYAAGATARQVYIPEGTWYQWHTGERLTGKRFVLADAPMEYIPIYARGGAVIPMWPDAPDSTANYHPSTIELHAFVPEADGEYTSFLHEDDGLTFGFHEGAFYRTNFSLRKEGNGLTVSASVSGGGYPEFARTSFKVIFHNGSGPVSGAASVDGKQIAITDNTLDFPNSGTDFELTVALD